MDGNTPIGLSVSEPIAGLCCCCGLFAVIGVVGVEALIIFM